jgi:mono/diheme cytochrome c family protein
MKDDDLELAIDDPRVVEEGRGWYAQRCAFCHGGGGKGGKGPCLTCGKFSYSGNTNTEIFTTISIGIPRNRGGTMGAFGTTMTPEAILAVVTFLRSEETRRIKEGEIEDPYKFKQEKLKFPGE